MSPKGTNWENENIMKRLLSIICFSVLLLATAKAQSDTNVVIHKSDKTQYVIIFPPATYYDSIIRDVADEEAVEDIYTVLDDLNYYLYVCGALLERSGFTPLQADSDRPILLADENRWLKIPAQDFVGVLVYNPDGSHEFYELMDFISTLTDFGEGFDLFDVDPEKPSE